MSIYTHYTIEATTRLGEVYVYGIHSLVSTNTKATKNHPTLAQKTKHSTSLVTQSQQQIMMNT